MIAEVRVLTDRAGTWQETTELVGRLNRALSGCQSYFSVGSVSKAYRAIDNYNRRAVAPVVAHQTQVRRRKRATYPLSHL
jgi:hypothetical protein